jgi:rod shape determining protein RodA
MNRHHTPWQAQRSIRAHRRFLDPWLILFILLLMAYGLFVLYSAGGPVLVKKQAIRLLLGLLVMLVLAQIRPERIAQFTPWLYVLTVLLLAAVLIAGDSSKGAQRWLYIGIRFQPSELAKLTVPLMVAWYLRHRPLPPDWRDTLVALLILLVPAALVVVEPDLGTAILVAAAGFFVLFLAGLSWRFLLASVALMVASAPVIWHFLHDYQKRRILTLLDPESDPLNAGWNIIQSKIAIGSGGLMGKGWLQGTQTQLDFLPEHSTDFILSVLAEEFGFVGVVILMLLYFLIILRGFQIAAAARDSFSRLIAGALTLTFFVYLFINAGMISGLLPVVGVPLPLVSYGGTSIITLMAAFGIILSVHNHKKLIKQ